jgi:hypothetical protein
MTTVSEVLFFISQEEWQTTRTSSTHHLIDTVDEHVALDGLKDLVES